MERRRFGGGQLPDTGRRRLSPESQVEVQAATQAIDAECDGLIPVTKKARGRVFTLTDGDGGLWQEDNRVRGSGSATAGGEAADIATIWIQPGKPTALQVRIWSASGDWSHTVDYRFSSNGYLERTKSILVTFDVFDAADEASNGAMRLRTRYFDAKGREIDRKVRVRNLADGKRAKRSFADHQEAIYQSVRSLPFAKQLRK